MHSVTKTIFPVFAFKLTHRVIPGTFNSVLQTINQSRHTVWGHVPQWHDASDLWTRRRHTKYVIIRRSCQGSAFTGSERINLTPFPPQKSKNWIFKLAVN